MDNTLIFSNTKSDKYESYLAHYGMPRRSGRYPYGSGENPYQHDGRFANRVREMREQNFEYTDPETGEHYTGDTAIAKSMGMSTTEFRKNYQLSREQDRRDKVARAETLKARGMNNSEIAREMGFENESSVRALLNQRTKERMNKSQATADILKRMIDEKGMIDVGAGVERELGITKEKLGEALTILELDGYPVYGRRMEQITNPNQMTTLKVACPPGTEHKDIFDTEKIHSVRDYISHDNGETFQPRFTYPASMDSKRLEIRYSEDGGNKKDGVIELRRGVDDLSLGESHYSQVRILVDGNRYLKGMAVYSDDLPPGIDVRFNTNKTKDVPKMDVLKKIKDDPNNPFGSAIKDADIGGQYWYTDKNGEKKLGLINKRADEGDWGSWSDKLPSQFLSKQKMDLINKQLDLSKVNAASEFEDIKSLTNPTVKKNMLISFADDCDAAAVHLKAAALPRQKYQVILPLDSIKDDEVYAPRFKDGETVALIRYPHGGTFEIPILKVNNKQAEGRRVITKDAIDAVGINSNVAARLSGADFDGDTVMVIPCNSSTSKVKITQTSPLKGLEGFDPTLEYGGKPAGTFKKMTKANTQREMGKVSNLITDMTLKGANEEELARAVRHSMVVIDAEKHELDYKQSEEDNGIKALKKRYQGHIDSDTGRYSEGASTLISRASGEASEPKTRGSAKIDPETGEKYYTLSGETYEKNGKTIERIQRTTQMAKVKDAHELSSGTLQEEAYADYANYMKSLGNEARKEALATKPIKYSPSAKETYKNEYNSLESKLNIAELNAPREREAQRLATVSYEAKVDESMSKEEKKKLKQRELDRAREQVGASKEKIKVTDKEWEAIQSGAVSPTMLEKILKNADMSTVREYATPKKSTTLTDGQINRIKAMSTSGYSSREIADQMNIPISSVDYYVKGR